MHRMTRKPQNMGYLHMILDNILIGICLNQLIGAIGHYKFKGRLKISILKNIMSQLDYCNKTSKIANMVKLYIFT